MFLFLYRGEHHKHGDVDPVNPPRRPSQALAMRAGWVTAVDAETCSLANEGWAHQRLNSRGSERLSNRVLALIISPEGA
jgi:hypothetical protein